MREKEFPKCGEWVNHRGNYTKNHLWRCSVCGTPIRSEKLKYRSEMPDKCPNCGAEMRDGEKNDNS